MTDDWDFYAARVDGKPASLYVNLGAEADAPVAGLTHVAHLRLRMRNPRDDGLSSQAEFDQLVRIEDALTAALCDAHTAYVGRNTSNGCRDFYFYVSTPDAWPDRTAAVMQAFAGYEFQTGTREDAAWSVYEEFLLPGAWDRERIENRRVCEQLEAHGDKLSAPREIDHFVWVPTLTAASAFLDEVGPLGFQPKGDPTHDDDRDAIGVQVARVDVPSPRGIDAVVRPLFDAAQRQGGEYDGWGCEVQD